MNISLLHEMGEEHSGEMSRLYQLRIADVTPKAYDGDYVVILSHGEFAFCVDVDFVDDAWGSDPPAAAEAVRQVHRSALRGTSRFGFAGVPNAPNIELSLF